MKSTSASVVSAVLLNVLLLAEAAASPTLMPYVIKSRVTLEGGFGFTLEVCGEVLCRLEITTPAGKVKVPAKNLSGVVDPDILSSRLYADFSKARSGSFIFEIPLIDFSDGERSPTQSVAVFLFENVRLEKHFIEERNARAPDQGR